MSTLKSLKALRNLNVSLHVDAMWIHRVLALNIDMHMLDFKQEQEELL
jgi:hypothetical protein